MADIFQIVENNGTPKDIGDSKARNVISNKQFNPQIAYAVNDIVWYEGKLYKFIVAHSAGSWNSNQVQEINIGTELNSKVSKSGDTMTGRLIIDNVNPEVWLKLNQLEYDKVPASQQFGAYYFYDKNNNSTGWVGNSKGSDGYTTTSINARGKINNNEILNYLRLGIAPSGEFYIQVPDKNLWRDYFEIQMANDTLPNNSNLNNCTKPGSVYYLSMNSTYTNHPNSGVQTILLVFNPFRNEQTHMHVQVAIQKNEKIFIRTCFDNIWSAWRMLQPTANGWQPAGTNIDNLTSPGTYGISATLSYSGVLPSGVTSGILEVIAPAPYDTYVIQKLFTGNAIYTRYRSGSSGTAWGYWYKYTGTNAQ